MNVAILILAALFCFAIGLGLGLLRTPSPKRRLALIEKAIRRRRKGRVELRAAAYMSVFSERGVLAVVVADRGEAPEALADRLLRQAESAEAETKEQKEEGPSCARWEDGARTEIWRVFSWCYGDDHADRMCWLLDGYLRGVERSFASMHDADTHPHRPDPISLGERGPWDEEDEGQ